MDQAFLLAERVLFSPHLPEAVNRLLQEAVASERIDSAPAEALKEEAA